ncbi:MAG: extracellular solute-binding protein, partial [Chloroflexota bacterium]
MRQFNQFKLISLSFIALLFVLLIGCSGSTPDEPVVEEPADQSAEQSEASTEAEETESDDESMEDDEIVLTHWYHQYGEEGTFEAVLRYAEEYSAMTPGVTVEVEWIPGDYNGALNAALLTDDGPDVFEVQSADLARVGAGQLEPLNDLFTDEVLADFSETALQRVTVDGNIYAIPMIVDPQLFYYRKGALEEAGLTIPTTMDELIAAAAALDTGRVKGLYIGNDQIGPPWTTYVSTYAAGTNLTDGGSPAFNTDANVTMLEKRTELAQSGNLLVGAPTDWWDPTALNDGLANMQWIGLWAAPAILDTHGDDIGVFPWPALDADGTPAVWVGSWNQAVNGNSDHKEAAKAYASWLWIENTEIQQDWALSYGFHIPPRASAAASAAQLQEGVPLEIVELTNQYGRSFSPMWTGAMQSALRDAQAEVILNGADAVEQMNSAEATVQSELDSLGSMQMDEAMSEDDDAATAEGEEIVLTHWYHQYGEEGTFEAVQRYAAEYSELTPGVTVEIEWIPGDYNGALNAALLTDDGPDVFEVQSADLARVGAGQLEPLNDLFSDDVLADFSETALQRVTVDGNIYAIPMIVDPQLFYYRKSALEEAGLTPPTTMDELIAAAAALDTGRVKGLYIGNDQIGPPWTTYVSTYAAGTNLTDGGAAAFNTADNVTMLEKRTELAQSGNLLVGAPTDWWDPTALNDGLANMQWIGLWAAPAVLDAHGDDIGVFPWPALDADGTPAVWVGSWNQA